MNFHLLPAELLSKIYMYAHPSLSSYTQNAIKNYQFVSKNLRILHRNSRYCRSCFRYHRIPKHFSCN